MNKELIEFIELCLLDGVITEKERQVIFRKAKELGVDKDECEILVDSLTLKLSGVKNTEHNNLNTEITFDFTVENEITIQLLHQFEVFESYKDSLALKFNDNIHSIKDVFYNRYKEHCISGSDILNRISSMDGSGFFSKKPLCWERKYSPTISRFLSDNPDAHGLYFRGSIIRSKTFVNPDSGNADWTDAWLVLCGTDSILFAEDSVLDRICEISFIDMLKQDKTGDYGIQTNLASQIKLHNDTNGLFVLSQQKFLINHVLRDMIGSFKFKVHFDYQLNSVQRLTELLSTKKLTIKDELWNVINRLSDFQDELNKRLKGSITLLDTKGFNWESDGLLFSNELEGPFYPKEGIQRKLSPILNNMELFLSSLTLLIRLINCQNEHEYQRLYFALERSGLASTTFQKKLLDKMDSLISIQQEIAVELKSFNVQMLSKVDSLITQHALSSQDVQKELSGISSQLSLNNVLLGIGLYQNYKQRKNLK